MPYNNQISRADAANLIPTEVSAEIIKSVADLNPLMRLGRRLPNMSRQVRTMPVMSALATAYFVSGDTGLKQTSELNWAGVNITAEELAVIVPIPEAVLNDTDYDIWGEVKLQIAEALSLAITQAVLYGTNIPAAWATDLGCAGLFAGGATAGHNVHIGAYADAYEAILGETAAGVDGLFMMLEADGFAVTGSVGHVSVRGLLRNTRTVNGTAIFPNVNEVGGTPIYYPTDGSIAVATSLMFSGDWNRLVYAMRQDITYKILTEAVIQGGDGAIIYNLAQQDMVALRAVMRLGFALPNPINRMQAVAANRFPFAVLEP
jgi:HK97 family phage major capsid protein